MRTKLLTSCAVLLAAFLLATNPVVAHAARLVTGGDIKNGSVTTQDIKDGSLTGADIRDEGIKGADIKTSSITGGDVLESSLGTVPRARQLAPLHSGQSESGTFSAAAGNSGAGGWLGFAINFPRPLATAIDEANIIDTAHHPDPFLCPGPGLAERGYLCLYSNARSNVGDIYGYSTTGPYADLTLSVGIGLYVPVTGAAPYVDGVWTVTAL